MSEIIRSRLARLLVGLCAMAMLGCVSERRYDAAMARASTLGVELRSRDVALSDATTAARLANARVVELQARVERLDADRRLRAERDAAYRAFLDSVLDVYRAVAGRLRSREGTDGVRLAVRNGLLVLELPADDLFVADRADLKSSSTLELDAVAGTMKELPTWRFQIAGHTDDAPLTPKRTSLWELSSSRAVRLVEFLVQRGVAAAQLSAAGFAGTLPVETNATNEGRTRNRRIEITFVPDVLLDDAERAIESFPHW